MLFFFSELFQFRYFILPLVIESKSHEFDYSVLQFIKVS